MSILSASAFTIFSPANSLSSSAYISADNLALILSSISKFFFLRKAISVSREMLNSVAAFPKRGNLIFSSGIFF